MAARQQVIHLETFLSLSVPSRVEAIILSRGGRERGASRDGGALGSWQGRTPFPSQPLCHCGRKLVRGGRKDAGAACRLKYCFLCWYPEHLEQRQWESVAPCLRRTQTDIFPPLLSACSRTQAPSRIRAPKPSYLTLIARLPGGRGQFL